MPILTLQRRMRELGRIRTGIQEEFERDGRKGRRPAKLGTFRLTSDAKALIEAAAELYGGEVRPWQSPAGPEWEVVTTAESLDIVVPPGQAFGQWFELWSGGGCQRRCDGETNVLTDGPCECPADPAERIALAAKGEACKPTTRLNVILPSIPDLGVWRLESHGFYAAVELAGAAEVLAAATASGRLIPARLRLDQREKKVPGKPTNRYAVPVIEFHQTRMADLLGSGGADLVPAQLEARPARPALPPGPELPERSDFRAPPSTEASAGPEASAAASESADLAFDEPAAAPDGTVARDAGLTPGQFMALVQATDGVDSALVVATARELHPGIANLAALSDEARGHLWDAVLAKLPAPVGR